MSLITNKHVDSKLFANDVENFNLSNISENNTDIFKEINDVVNRTKRELLYVSLHQINRTYSKILTDITIMKSKNSTNCTVLNQHKVLYNKETVSPVLKRDMSVNRPSSTVKAHAHHSNKPGTYI